MQEGNKAERKSSYLLVSSLDVDASPKSWLAQSCSRGLIHGPRGVKEEEVVASAKISGFYIKYRELLTQHPWSQKHRPKWPAASVAKTCPGPCAPLLKSPRHIELNFES
jgi:hypothetical protein